MVASEKGHKEVVEILLSAGANFNFHAINPDYTPDDDYGGEV